MAHQLALTEQAARSRLDVGFGWLDAEGRIDVERGLPLWINARMTHVFSLSVLLGRDGDADLVDHGLSALREAFQDGQCGGWYARLDGMGEPTTTAKSAYEHAFVLLAASSATLAGRPGAPELLADAIDVVGEHFWDDGTGAFVEEWDRGWAKLSDYRGANANMHLVEACLAVAGATGDGTWVDRALRVAVRFIDGAAREHGWRVPEHYGGDFAVLPDYNRDSPADPFRPFGVTPGHGMEWARLLLHLHAQLRLDAQRRLDAQLRLDAPAPTWLVDAAKALFQRAIEDGWDAERGGFCYTTDWDGVPVTTSKLHWVVCEAIGAASALYQASGEVAYRHWEARFWDYADHAFIGPTRFGWIHEVDADNRPATTGTWTGRPDFYHAVQATLIPRLPLAPSMAAALAARAFAA